MINNPEFQRSLSDYSHSYPPRDSPRSNDRQSDLYESVRFRQQVPRRSIDSRLEHMTREGVNNPRNFFMECETHQTPIGMLSFSFTHLNKAQLAVVMEKIEQKFRLKQDIVALNEGAFQIFGAVRNQQDAQVLNLKLLEVFDEIEKESLMPGSFAHDAGFNRALIPNVEYDCLDPQSERWKKHIAPALRYHSHNGPNFLASSLGIVELDTSRPMYMLSNGPLTQEDIYQQSELAKKWNPSPDYWKKVEAVIAPTDKEYGTIHVQIDETDPQAMDLLGINDSVSVPKKGILSSILRYIPRIPMGNTYKRNLESAVDGENYVVLTHSDGHEVSYDSSQKVAYGTKTSSK